MLFVFNIVIITKFILQKMIPNSEIQKIIKFLEIRNIYIYYINLHNFFDDKITLKRNQ